MATIQEILDKINTSKSNNINNNSFIDLMRQISGNPEDGIQPVNDANSIYGHIVQMYTELFNSSSTYTTIVDEIETIKSVFENLDEINSVDSIKRELESIFADKLKLDSIFADKNKLDSLFFDKITLDSLFADKAKLDSLFTDKAKLDSLFANKFNIDTVSENITDVNTVSDNIENVNLVGEDITNVNLVSEELVNIGINADNITNIAIAGSNIFSINTVANATNLSDIIRVAADLNSLDVNGIADITIVANDLVLGVDSNIITVSESIDNVNITGNDIDNINIVGTDIANVDIVSTNINNINITANDIVSINTVSSNIANVNTVLDEITNINTVSGSIANVNTVASNIVGLNSIVSNMPEILLADDNAAIATTKALESSDSAAASLQSSLDSADSAALFPNHIADTTNPHEVTKIQVGLEFAENTADIDKIVASAGKLTSAVNISLSGDVSGSVSFDGSNNVNIATIIGANSVTLGTDTTGNYVAGLTQGTGISVTGSVGEGWSPTVSLANVGTAGTYKSVTTDAQGRVISGTNPTTLSGYGITDATHSSHIGSSGTSHGVVTTSVNGFMSSTDKSKLDGIAANANNYAHPTSGVGAGTYKSVTVDTNGHITSGTNPTTVSGYGLTDVYTKTENNTSLALKVNNSEKGVANGIATLDTNGKVVLTQIPDSLLGQLEYIGIWNFATLPTATEKGQYWIASVAGNGYEVGDWAVWNGSAFDKVDNTDAVATVAGRTGNVVLTKNDVGLGLVDNTADASKNVLSATKWAAARTVTLSGDVAGSASIDGSANVTITTTVQPNSVALGTDTTGNYVADVTAGTGISISGTAVEGWSPTITNTAPNVTTNITTTHNATNVGVNSSDGTNGTINSATQTLAGVMTAADKSKLDGITTGATANVGTVTSIATSGAITGGTVTSTGTISHSTADGYLHVPATGTTNNGKVLTAGATAGSLSWIAIPSAPVASVAGKTGAVTLVKGDVGLANVDNTADSAKPVSTSQQTALNLKANLASPVFTGNVTGLGVATGTSFNSITGLSSIVGTTSGTAAVGTSTTVARADHVHPSDTTKVTKVTSTDKAIVRFNGATGDIQNSGVVINDNNVIINNSAGLSISPVIGGATSLYNWLDTSSLDIWAGVTQKTGIHINGQTASGGSYFSVNTGGVQRMLLNGSGMTITGAISASTNFIGSLTGNAETATKLATARTITLSGAVTGSTIFDGSGNVTLSAQVADNSHNHTIANIAGLQSALDGKLSTSGKAADADKLDGLDSSQFLRRDTSDTMTGNLTVTGTATATKHQALTHNVGTGSTGFDIAYNSTTKSLDFNFVG